MKKIFARLLLAISLVAATCSCQGPMGPMGPQDEGMNWEVLNVDVPAGSWRKSDDGSFFFANVKVPQLTKMVCEEGMVQCYIKYSDGQQALLPTVRYESDGKDLWQRLIDYEFSVGNLDLYYTTNDFAYDPSEPGHLTFRLVLQW